MVFCCWFDSGGWPPGVVVVVVLSPGGSPVFGQYPLKTSSETIMRRPAALPDLFPDCIDFDRNARLGASHRKGVSITIFLQMRIQATFINHFLIPIIMFVASVDFAIPFVPLFLWFFVSSFCSRRFSRHQLLVAFSQCKDLLENP